MQQSIISNLMWEHIHCLTYYLTLISCMDLTYCHTLKMLSTQFTELLGCISIFRTYYTIYPSIFIISIFTNKLDY